jgi:hypothetical protein
MFYINHMFNIEDINEIKGLFIIIILKKVLTLEIFINSSTQEKHV